MPIQSHKATAAGVADSAADTKAANPSTAEPTPTEWHLVTVSALHEAEELLDCLEAHGFAERELLVLSNSCFVVRWRSR